MEQIICFLYLSNPKDQALILMEMAKLKQPLWADLTDGAATLSTYITTNIFFGFILVGLRSLHSPYPSVLDLKKIKSEKSSLTNWILVYFELDSYCLCSLQKSENQADQFWASLPKIHIYYTIVKYSGGHFLLIHFTS